MLRLVLWSELLNFCYRWLRWLDWHRKKWPGEPVWRTVWMWFIYQVVSGYPPGETHHWFEDAPPFLFEEWREQIKRLGVDE